VAAFERPDQSGGDGAGGVAGVQPAPQRGAFDARIGVRACKVVS
jgi:hypothetical protein